MIAWPFCLDVQWHRCSFPSYLQSLTAPHQQPPMAERRYLYFFRLSRHVLNYLHVYKPKTKFVNHSNFQEVDTYSQTYQILSYYVFLQKVKKKKKTTIPKTQLRILNIFPKKQLMCIFVHNSLPNGQLFIICLTHMVNNRYNARPKSQRSESHIVPAALVARDSTQGQTASAFHFPCVLFIAIFPSQNLFFFIWVSILQEQCWRFSSKNIDIKKYHMLEIQHE